MSTNVTREAPPPSQPLGGQVPEQAPSVLAQDDPVIARLVGMIAAALVIFGGAALLFQSFGRPTAVGTGWATLWLTVGIIGLLFHAAYDTDAQFRRLYMFFGYVAVGVGALLCTIQMISRTGGQFGTGCLLLALAVCFLLAFLRNETDPKLRDICHLVLGGAGALFALIGLVGGHLRTEFLWPAAQPVTDPTVGQPIIWPYGLFLGFLGLVYMTACIGSRGVSDDRAYRLGQFLGLLGALVFVLALARSLFPGTFSRSANPQPFFIPAGVMLMFLGLLYVLTALFMISDNSFVVLTRRELDGFFFTPVAYLVLFGFTVAHWLTFYIFITRLHDSPAVPEPIVRNFAFQISTIFFVVFAVPALTMRLLSEEQRTGTLEVLLTSPVDETAVVLSKFFAAFLLYLLMWVPFVLFVVALRVLGGREFDYRPLLSFGVAVAVTGAGFIAMGVFCSSLSRNQIIGAVLAFTGMLLLTLIFILKLNLTERAQAKNGLLENILEHVSYIDLWNNAIEGKLVLRVLLFPISMAIFFLFVTIKILEARKWK
jgi:ABC-2 type transport system permease protein